MDENVVVDIVGLNPGLRIVAMSQFSLLWNEDKIAHSLLLYIVCKTLSTNPGRY